MHLFSVKNQQSVQQKPATALLLIFCYVLSIFYSVSHVHDAHYLPAESVYEKLAGQIHSLHHHDEPDHWEHDTHECLACQFQSKPHASGVIVAPLVVTTDPVGVLLATSQPFHATPTKRLTRAPPVA
ncbi:MAG: DUF2946 family protein [Endozoicomonas sp.]